MMRDTKNGKLELRRGELETRRGEHEIRRGEHELRRGERVRSPLVSKGERLSEHAYKNLKIYDFLDILSSTSPMPGGGVVAALVAANATSLILKVINLSIGKKKFIKYDKLLNKSKTELEKLNLECLKMMEEDSLAFKSMEIALKLPREDEKQIKFRNKELNKAYKICIKPGIKLINLSKKIMKIIDRVHGKTSVLAKSDLNIAKVLLIAVIKSCMENVHINTEYLDDRKYVEKIYNKLKFVSSI